MTIEHFLKHNPTKAIVMRADATGKLLVCVAREDRPNVILSSAISASHLEGCYCAIRRFNESEAREQSMGVQT